jgi:ribosomal protein S18 acetylase RimI-like enzyme
MDNKFLELFDQNIKRKFSYLASHNKKMAIQTFGHIVLIDSGLNSNMFNIIYCNESCDQQSVKAAIDYFKSKKLPYAFWIGFENDPSWLEQELLFLGLVTDETEWAMICDLDKQKPIPIHFDFDIREVQELAEIKNIIIVINQIIPVDEHLAIQSFYEQSAAVLLSKNCSLTFFIGYENGKPISLSSLFCDQEVASIFDVIVLPEMRGKGLGKAMTLKAMLSAQEKGFNKCVLTATNDAKYLYQKLGFNDVKTMKVYHEP